MQAELMNELYSARAEFMSASLLLPPMKSRLVAPVDACSPFMLPNCLSLPWQSGLSGTSMKECSNLHTCFSVCLLQTKREFPSYASSLTPVYGTMRSSHRACLTVHIHLRQL